MKPWQIEQILYLNDVNKNKLALPTSQEIWQGEHADTTRMENIIIGPIRKFITLLRNVL